MGADPRNLKISCFCDSRHVNIGPQFQADLPPYNGKCSCLVGTCACMCGCINNLGVEGGWGWIPPCNEIVVFGVCGFFWGWGVGREITVSVCWEFCPNDIFLTTEPFVTKLGIMVHHHELDCYVENWFAIFRVKVTVSAPVVKMGLFVVYIFWTISPFVIKHSLMVEHHKLRCHVEILDYHQGHSKSLKFQCLYRRYVLNLR